MRQLLVCRIRQEDTMPASHAQYKINPQSQPSNKLHEHSQVQRDKHNKLMAKHNIKYVVTVHLDNSGINMISLSICIAVRYRFRM